MPVRGTADLSVRSKRNLKLTPQIRSIYRLRVIFLGIDMGGVLNWR